MILFFTTELCFAEESFFDKFDREEEGKLRPFPSWYGSLDMGSLSHLYSPENPITDSNIDQLLAIEREDFSSWKRVKKSRELEIFSRKGTGRASPPVTKVTKTVSMANLLVHFHYLNVRFYIMTFFYGINFGRCHR